MKAHVFYGGNTCVCLAEHSVVAAYKLAGITYNPLLASPNQAASTNNGCVAPFILGTIRVQRLPCSI
ncbi:hypothetical protein [Sporolactobacillus inulinus]|uniref:Uncharacterized protein n=1 Tax=Sporolactobacillus inulinus CASD TaxID=1069536 RepID=A0A0U1QQ87_9BACL|nr:hypothetical protein [Sporolactobacillus inulinus]KLI02954.1 hypothetical protein SINU_05385 [Sporolactobacillus inulinus CASD]